ncbi:hypothetical protein K3495_g3784 [Podosphaera aphanis]|nr:hypothetical protein K3495_g3784 [Podosphaera aphanis]
MFSSVPDPPQSSLIDSSSSQVRTRLRPFSYLRTYRQNHSHSLNGHGSHHVSAQCEARSSGSRSTSYLPQLRAPIPPRSQGHSFYARSYPAERTTPEAPPRTASNTELSGTTSGWLPTVGGQSGVSRIVTEPKATVTGSPSAVLSNHSLFPEDSNVMSPTHTSTSRMGSDHEESENVGPQVLSTTNENVNSSMSHQLPSIRLSAHQDPRAQRPSLVFPPMFRILPSGQEVLRVGRYSEKDLPPTQSTNIPSSAPIGFKSKVVSRRHCEFWWSGGTWYIKDVKSSSGTFLNHIRLSAPGIESRPFPVRDGDIVQLGIDFKGGEEMIFRCVKIKVELNKGWQVGPSSFNVQSHKRLRELNNLGKLTKSGPSQDCSICLGPIAPCQSLFVAPCSHTWHYKCIRVIINGPIWPHFICPNCRNVADLEAETDDPHLDDWEGANVDEEDDKPSSQPTSSNEAVRGKSPSTQKQTEELSHQEPAGLEEAAQAGNVTREISDNSDRQRVNEAAQRLDYVRFYDSSSCAENSDFSNTSVAPSEALPKRSLERSVTSHSSSAAVPGVQPRTRTPSPQISRSHEVSAGVEGPMTPRNNLGPFVFDGNDGNLGNAIITPINLDATAESPLETSQPSHPS